MKRSRLKLFKTTSLTISFIGVILILITIGIFAYVAITGVTNSVSTTVNSGGAYDELSQLKSQFNNISDKYLALSDQVTASDNQNLKVDYNTGKLKLSEANQTLSSVENYISNGKSEDEINKKMDEARKELTEVDEIYNNLTGGNK